MYIVERGWKYEGGGIVGAFKLRSNALMFKRRMIMYCGIDLDYEYARIVFWGNKKIDPVIKYEMLKMRIEK